MTGHLCSVMPTALTGLVVEGTRDPGEEQVRIASHASACRTQVAVPVAARTCFTRDSCASANFKPIGVLPLSSHLSTSEFLDYRRTTAQAAALAACIAGTRLSTI